SKEGPPCAAIRDTEKRKHQERKRVNEMIKHSLVPDVEHSVRFEYLFETMRSESAQCDGKKTKRNRNPKKQNRHLAISSGVNTSPTAFLDHSGPIVGSGESFSNGNRLTSKGEITSNAGRTRFFVNGNCGHSVFDGHASAVEDGDFVVVRPSRLVTGYGFGQIRVNILFAHEALSDCVMRIADRATLFEIICDHFGR